jgi:hypothetical protein
MALSHCKVPQVVEAACRKALAHPHEPSAAYAHERAGVYSGDLQTVPIYILGARGISALNPKARQVGWLALAYEDAAASASECSNAPLNAIELRAGRHRGPDVNKAWECFQHLASEVPDSINDYEIRLLRVPELLFESFWLKKLPIVPASAGSLGADDWICTFSSLRTRLPEGTFQRAAEFLHIAKVLVDTLYPVRR